MSQSDFKTLEKKINEGIRKAQSNMFSGKNDEAWNMIEDIQKDFEMIQSIDPSYQSISLIEQKVNRLKQDLEKKLGKGTSTTLKPEVRSTSAPGPRSPPSAPLPTTKTQAPEDKLPTGVTKRLQDMERLLTQVKQLMEQDRDNKESLMERASYQLQLASGMFSEIERMYAAQLGHPDVKAAQEKIGTLTEGLKALKLKMEVDKDQAATVMKQISDESQKWVEKIRPYLSSGEVRENQLDLSIIRGKDNLLRQRDLLTKVKKLYNEYQSHKPASHKTPELEQAEKDLMRMMNEGEGAYNQSIKTIIEEAASIFDQKIDWFKSDDAWRNDEKIRPKWLDKYDRDVIDEKMGKVNELVPEILHQSSPELLSLEDKHQRLEKENLERLSILPLRTFMVPEKYEGSDAEALRARARELVREKEPSAKILRVHLIREDWRVEDLIEYTDTSMTVVHHRITYILPAQVAAETSGKILIYNVHIAKNQRPDGSFDKYYGNLEDYPQTIAKENLPKTE